MKNKAHVWMCGLLSATMAFTSCTNFLEEDPKTFLSPSEYYTTENQIKAAVDGTYDGLDDLLSSDLEIATVHLFNLEYLVGTSYRPRAAVMSRTSSCCFPVWKRVTALFVTSGRLLSFLWKIVIA